MTTTIEEWRVTGDPGPDFGPYGYTWSSQLYDHPEQRARAFVAMLRDTEPWVAGPFLHHRTVTYGEWEEATPWCGEHGPDGLVCARPPGHTQHPDTRAHAEYVGKSGELILW